MAIKGTTYKFKETGELYFAAVIATLKSDGTRLVIYHLIDSQKVWARPETEFDEKFEQVAQ